MSRQQPPPSSDAALRTYPSRFEGPVLLVCRRCQRKVKHADEHSEAANLKKSFKKLGKGSGAPLPHIFGVPCMKLCPKGAVTVCTPQNLLDRPPTLTLIRTRQDIALLYRQCTEEQSFDPR
jgi:hypothetical protein